MDATLERILELMKDKRVTAYTKESVLGVPHGSFLNWERGKGKSFYEHIDRISEQLCARSCLHNVEKPEANIILTNFQNSMFP